MSTVLPPPPDQPLPGRRTFFSWLTYAVAALATAAVSIPFIGYLFGARKAPVEWFPLGRVTDFPLNQTRSVAFNNPLRTPWDGMAAHTAVFVRYQGEDKFLILAANCAHLGCPVEWFQESGLFMCPCHGGVYYATGERASGPPPRGLFPCVYKVTRQGGVDQLEIQAPHFPTLQDTLSHPSSV
jgi:Rieske Fe-S protein